MFWAKRQKLVDLLLMQEYLSESVHAFLKVELTIEKFLDLHRNNVSIDHIYLLKYYEQCPGIVLPENERVQAAIQFLQRKSFLTEKLEITVSGKALIEGSFFKESSYVFSKLKEVRSNIEEDFEAWWNEYPNSDRFEHKGKKFEGHRIFKVKKEFCKKLFIKIINEGKYTAEDLIRSLRFEIKLKKDESVRKSDNVLRFLRNTHTYLTNATFESFVEDSKDWQGDQSSNSFPGNDISI